MKATPAEVVIRQALKIRPESLAETAKAAGIRPRELEAFMAGDAPLQKDALVALTKILWHGAVVVTDGSRLVPSSRGYLLPYQGPRGQRKMVVGPARAT